MSLALTNSPTGAPRDLTAWTDHIRRLMGEEDASIAAGDAAYAPGFDLMAWLKAHKTAVFIVAASMFALAILKKK